MLPLTRMAGDDDLFDWCAARPLWQQEAIRLLSARPSLDADELNQLEQAVRTAAGLSNEKPPAWPALTKTHLKAGNRFAPVTVLGSIGPLRNIDRLAAEQPPLKFAINGVTLIYGPNGSGKSGYCRIAKKICHCLHGGHQARYGDSGDQRTGLGRTDEAIGSPRA